MAGWLRNRVGFRVRAGAVWVPAIAVFVAVWLVTASSASGGPCVDEWFGCMPCGGLDPSDCIGDDGSTLVETLSPTGLADRHVTGVSYDIFITDPEFFDFCDDTTMAPCDYSLELCNGQRCCEIQPFPNGESCTACNNCGLSFQGDCPVFLGDPAGPPWSLRVTDHFDVDAGELEYFDLTICHEADSVCGDGFCSTQFGENCETCPVDCENVCGDGCCGGTETCCSCPQDCATCCEMGTCGCGEGPGGVTIVTHGFSFFPGAPMPGWVDAMADAIAWRTGSPEMTSVWTIRVSGDPATVSDVILDSGPNAFSADYNGNIIIKLDWSALSSPFTGGPGLGTPTGEVAAGFVAYLLNTQTAGRYWIEQPIHLIGFSRGGSLVSVIARQLGEAGVWVEQLTTLDPHPVDGVGKDCGPVDFGDAPAEACQTVTFADDYWRSDGVTVKLPPGVPCDPDGEFVAGAFDVAFEEAMFTGTGYVNEHFDLRLWYHGTIDYRATASDGEKVVPDTWYDAADMRYGPRASAGFNWSRLAGGAVDTEPAREGLHTSFGGLGQRVPVDLSGANWPGLMLLRIPTGHEYTVGEQIHVTYYYQDVDSNATARFYLDPDRNPYNGNEVLLGERFLQQTGSIPWDGGAFWDTIGVPPGEYFLWVAVSDGPRRRIVDALNPVAIFSVADFNRDGSVDLVDFQLWSGCMLGPDVPATGKCMASDFAGGASSLSGDGFVDLEDAAVFQTFFDG